MKAQFFPYIQNLQDQITQKLESLDHLGQFKEENWERPEGGGGRTRVLEGGAVFEKGGVNISAVHGELPKSMQDYFKVGESTFYACGLSLVIHPKNPWFLLFTLTSATLKCTISKESYKISGLGEDLI